MKTVDHSLIDQLRGVAIDWRHAALIAAAPETTAALAELVHMTRQWVKGGIGQDAAMRKGVHKRANAALAKARGQS